MKYMHILATIALLSSTLVTAQSSMNRQSILDNFNDEQEYSISGSENSQQSLPENDTEPENSDEQKEKESEYLFNDLMNQQNLNTNYSRGYSSTWNAQGALDETTSQKVIIGLDEYKTLRSKSANIDKLNSTKKGPVVILGSSSYTGKTIHGSLSLRCKLHATLGGKGLWKAVPLVGNDVILVAATANGKAIPVSSQNNYHVWITNSDGEVSIEVDIMVPAQGPRGSIEYDFTAVRTPSTSFNCVFPVAGLEPRLTAAVQSDYVKMPGATGYTATLRPTTRIHLIGFKEFSGDAKQDAKVYAESMNLLSVDEDALEMFSVFYYTILYSGVQKFTITIPDGFKIVSADGRGAFRYTLETTADGNRLIGETEYPIHNKFEISLRLRKEINKKGETFSAPLPRCVDVERESGWLGIEVPGKMQLVEKSTQSVLQVDMRQLPSELLQSTVSPVLKAYRYHAADARVMLYTASLPEIEPASGSIDNIQLYTKIAEDGASVSEMQITLRNRLRHNLEMELPFNAQVLSAMLDDQPLTISQNRTGKILLPLKRSSGDEQLKPFTISLTYKNKISAITSLGLRTLRMPALDLPVSSILWDVYVPGFNTYSRLKSTIAPQRYQGQVSWKKLPPSDAYSGNSISNNQSFAGRSDIDNSVAGTMPVQIKIPLSGKKLTFKRYWLEKNGVLGVSFSFIRSSLLLPILFFLFIIIATAVWGLFFITPNVYRYCIAVSLIILFITAITIQGYSYAFGAIITGLIATFFLLKKYRFFATILHSLKKSFDLKDIKPEKFSLKLFLSALRYVVFGIAAIILLILCSRLFNVLINNPLG
jgi:hypothetical protein